MTDFFDNFSLPPEAEPEKAHFGAMAEYLAHIDEELARRRVEDDRYDWAKQARAKQLPPGGDWRVWLLLAGRGFGKTRAGAEWVRAVATENPAARIAIVGTTAADVRDVLVEGPSGVLAIARNEERPLYEPSKRRITWPSGAVATTYSADEPDRLRGPQHTHSWCDELAAWRYPNAWDMLMFGLRIGAKPRALVTTTPRPTKIIKALVNDPTTAVVIGSSYENRANLSPVFFDRVVSQYEGTRLGRQELEAEILEDVPGALWSSTLIEATRLREPPDLTRVVVAIDPAASHGENADETGIVVVGKDARRHGYVLADLSGRMAPVDWAKAAIAAYRTHRADRIVAEVNNGGEMVEATLRQIDPDVPFTAVHATRGKVVRAEPVAALYEQGRAHHIGVFSALEDQMCSFTPDLDRSVIRVDGERRRRNDSPDRVDALVWAFTELLVELDSGAEYFEAMRGILNAGRRQEVVYEPAARPVQAPGSREWIEAMGRGVR